MLLQIYKYYYYSFSDPKDQKMFIECFFEAQASITEDLKRSIDEREWAIDIDNGKTAHEVLYEKYFMKKFINAGCKLNRLNVNKNILSEDEKKLLILCSTNVHGVYFNREDHPVKIDGWSPEHKIQVVVINIRNSLLSKDEFEVFVLPWIRLTKELYLHLHDDTNFMEGICEWLHVSSFKRFVITYRGNEFDINNIAELKKLK